MHSSRMHTALSSSRLGGSPPGHPQSRHLLGPGTPRPDPPQFPPWLWAWTRSPSTSPLGVGLDQIPLHFPLGCGPGDLPWRPAARHAGIPPAMHAGIAPPPPVDRHTPVKLLPCSKLRLCAAMILGWNGIDIRQ